MIEDLQVVIPRHVRREANELADRMANEGINLTEGDMETCTHTRQGDATGMPSNSVQIARLDMSPSQLDRTVVEPPDRVLDGNRRSDRSDTTHMSFSTGQVPSAIMGRRSESTSSTPGLYGSTPSHD